MATLEALIAQLEDLEARLPQFIEDHPDHGDFWMAFVGEADLIEDAAGDHCQTVGRRIQEMLAKHSRYVSYMELNCEGE